MSLIYLLLIILIMIFSNSTIASAKNAVDLFAYSIIPSLFPFFVLTNMLLRSGTAALIPGFLCGYPSGAIACSSLYKNGKISKKKAEIFSAFISNAGPAFIVGSVGTAMCRSTKIGFLLLFTHLAASLTVASALFLIYGKKAFFSRGQSSGKQIPKDTVPFGEQLTNAIMAALKQIASVGGYIIFFSVLIGIFQELGITNGFFFSLIEITSGMKYIVGSIPGDNFMPVLISLLPTIAFLLGWSGISIHAQIISILSKAGIRLRFFMIGKFFQAVLAGIYTYLILKIPFIADKLSVSTFAETKVPLHTYSFMPASVATVQIVASAALFSYGIKSGIKKYISKISCK